ncbi:hypothetical protein ACLB1M_15875 [Escherichia coli]
MLPELVVIPMLVPDNFMNGRTNGVVPTVTMASSVRLMSLNFCSQYQGNNEGSRDGFLFGQEGSGSGDGRKVFSKKRWTVTDVNFCSNFDFGLSFVSGF